MIVARTRPELEKARRSLGAGTGRTALVPTMGSLHEGHLSLVDRARELADATVLSIFVNPTQFGPEEDFGDYPRELERDLEKADARGVSLIFAPESEAVVYPDGEPRISVDPGPMGDRLCGPFRPGHFAGVLTVVAKLLGLVRPDVAVFGRKDFQQTVLIRRMTRDLELGVRIETGPVIREDDGLALSSRNRYLSPEERADAPGLHEGLREARERFRAGERSAPVLRRAVREAVEARPRLRLQYVEVVDPESLKEVDPAPEGSVVAAAAFCGETRLIDNVVLDGSAGDAGDGVDGDG